MQLPLHSDSQSHAQTRRPFHLMAKPAGPICNLNCTYCFYLDKDRFYPGRHGMAPWIMSDEVLESMVRQYIESQDVPVIHFAWQGGEPTLAGLDFFARAVELQKKYANGKQIENALQTNGVLLDDAWCEFLARERFLIGLSVDGPEAVHDFYRVNRGGKGTFAQVMEGLEKLKQYRVEFNTLTTVHDQNVRRPLEVYEFLRSIGSVHWQFIPIVERLEQSDGRTLIAAPHAQEEQAKAESLAGWSVSPKLYGQFLTSIFDRWYQQDIGRIFIQHFENTLAPYMGMPPGMCVYAKTCGRALILEHNGDLFSCDHFMFPQYKLGNILQTPLSEMVESPQQAQFGCEKETGLPKDCRECKWLALCRGGCPKDRFARDSEGTHKLNYLCPGLKLFYNHVDQRMQKLAAKLQSAPVL